jgi:hypothetical protein
MATLIKGDVVLFYIKDSDGDWRPVGCLESNGIQQTQNVIRSRTKANSLHFTELTQGEITYVLNFSGFYIDTSYSGSPDKASYEYLSEVMKLNSLVYWKMDSGLVDSPAYYGYGMIGELNMEAAAGDNVTMFDGQIIGQWEPFTNYSMLTYPKYYEFVVQDGGQVDNEACYGKFMDQVIS